MCKEKKETQAHPEPIDPEILELHRWLEEKENSIKELQGEIRRLTTLDNIKEVGKLRLIIKKRHKIEVSLENALFLKIKTMEFIGNIIQKAKDEEKTKLQALIEIEQFVLGTHELLKPI